VRQFDQGKHGVAQQLEGFVAGHQCRGRVDRENAVSFVGKNDPGGRVVKDFLGQLLALGAGAALADVCVNGDEAAIGQRCTTNIECFAVRAGPLEMVRCRTLGAHHHGRNDALRFAWPVFAALGVETENGFEGDRPRLNQRGRKIQ
jgi:hypothetical protein